MFVFLQNWRTTLIPAIAVPVVLLGTFGVLAAFGYTINTLTMFALVLAIGLLVDDAIVVVENVERIMREEGLGPREATQKSMDEITGALVGIALVLSAVFLPMSFFGGSTGVIYRQFSVTIISAMVLSILVALILTPALCATLLKPFQKAAAWRKASSSAGSTAPSPPPSCAIASRWRRCSTRSAPALFVYAGLLVLLAVLMFRLPTGFLPEEDQGAIFAQITLPTGATQARTLAAGKAVEHYFLTGEKNNIEKMFLVAGFNFAGSGQNAGMAFIHLKNWSERGGSANGAQAIARRAMRALSKVRDAHDLRACTARGAGAGQLVRFRP